MFTTTSIIPGCTKLYLVTVLTNYSWLCLHFSEAGFEPTASGLLRNALTTPPNFEIKSLTFNCLIFDSSIHSFVRRVLLPFFLCNVYHWSQPVCLWSFFLCISSQSLLAFYVLFSTIHYLSWYLRVSNANIFVNWRYGKSMMTHRPYSTTVYPR